jgi:hypothetical protein
MFSLLSLTHYPNYIYCKKNLVHNVFHVDPTQGSLVNFFNKSKSDILKNSFFSTRCTEQDYNGLQRVKEREPPIEKKA